MTQQNDRPLVEGGMVENPGTAQIEVKGPFDIEKHRGAITVWLIVLLAVIILGHYGCLLVMEWNGKKVESLNNAYNAALPVISGLVGSAVAYYFTKGEKPTK